LALCPPWASIFPSVKSGSRESAPFNSAIQDLCSIWRQPAASVKLVTEGGN
jgi:hypothetical protein